MERHRGYNDSRNIQVYLGETQEIGNGSAQCMQWGKLNLWFYTNSGSASVNQYFNTCSSHIFYYKGKSTEKDTTSVHWEWRLNKIEGKGFRHVFVCRCYQSGGIQTSLYHSLETHYWQYTNDHTPFCAHITGVTSMIPRNFLKISDYWHTTYSLQDTWAHDMHTTLYYSL